MSILACDVGGTRIKLGVVSSGRLLANTMLPAHSVLGLAPALPRIREALLRLCGQAGVQPSECRGIGIGFPALVNSVEGRILDEYGKYADAPAIDLRTWAKDALGLPLAIDNDARTALLGEWKYGAGRGSDNLAIVTLGTGIGTAVLSKGRLLRGQDFRAGNLCGHLVVNPGGQLCACGQRGCVEAETAGRNLGERLRGSAGFAGSTLAAKPDFDYADVFNAAARGDLFCAAAIEQACSDWGTLCRHIADTFSVDRIVIGGGLMAAADSILPRIEAAAHATTSVSRHAVSIRCASHPDHMALLGCEVLVDELL